MWEFLIPLVLGLMFPSILFPFITNILITNRNDASEGIPEIITSQNNGAYSTVLIEMEDGIINDMPLELYIVSVVLREMPADFHSEALKAQAVAARTYAVRQMQLGKKHDPADVCVDSSCCQGFWDVESYLQSGGTSDDLAVIVNAVRDTSGKILIYENKPIDATYFSCSGGLTEDAVSVWGADVPYLKSQKSPGEEKATHYTDTVHFSINELAAKLNIKLTDVWDFKIGEMTYTVGGGVDTIVICGKEFYGTKVRQLLGLKSTAFVMTQTGESVIITTKGYGHRVGMSQYGAEAMGITGKDYTEILFHYYQGVELVSIDDLY